MTKRSPFLDWELCILCQVEQANEKLICPASIVRKGHDPTKSYKDLLESLQRFAELRSLPFEKLYISDENFKDQSIFIINKGKFHKACQLKISSLKLERLEKSQSKLKDTKDDIQFEQPAERRRSDRVNQPNENKKIACFFFVTKKPGDYIKRLPIN